MKNRLKLSLFFYLSLAAAIIILLASTLASQVQNVALNSEQLEEFNIGWKVSVNGQPMGENILPVHVPAQKNDLVEIVNQIPPDLKQNSTLLFRTSQSRVKVFVGDELLYSFGHEDKLAFGSVSGSAWQVIRIPINSFGKSITIQTTTPYSNYAGNLSEIYIGTKAAILFHIIGQSMLRLLLCFLIFIAGLALLTLYFFARKNLQNNGWLYLGIFSLLLGVWSLGETRILQLFFGNTYFVTNLVMLSLMILPIPFFLFLDSFACYRDDNIIKSGGILCCLNFVVCSVLQIMNITDYFKLITSTHILIVVFAGYAIVKTYYHFQQRRDRETFVIAFATMIILVSSVLDIIVFYRYNATVDTIFLRIGFLLFIVIVGAWTGQQAILLYSQRIEKETLSAMAYTDILTKLGNRAAFEACMDIYRNDAQTGNADILMFDLNNLKFVNDTYGHSAGDKLIVRAAALLDKNFSDLGKCFRIGGDEFCVICPQVSGELLSEHLSAFRQQLDEENQGATTALAVACGLARYLSSDDRSVDSVLVEADRNMYRCKAEMKQEQPELTTQSEKTGSAG